MKYTSNGPKSAMHVPVALMLQYFGCRQTLAYMNVKFYVNIKYATRVTLRMKNLE